MVKNDYLIIFLAAAITVFLASSSAFLAGASYLKIKFPDKNANVTAGQFIRVTGTSAPSNSTRTN